jgi:hypothetical protein
MELTDEWTAKNQSGKEAPRSHQAGTPSEEDAEPGHADAVAPEEENVRHEQTGEPSLKRKRRKAPFAYASGSARQILKPFSDRLQTGPPQNVTEPG